MVRTAWVDAKLTLTAPLGAIGTPEFLMRSAAVPPHPACGRPLALGGMVQKRGVFGYHSGLGAHVLIVPAFSLSTKGVRVSQPPKVVSDFQAN